MCSLLRTKANVDSLDSFEHIRGGGLGKKIKAGEEGDITGLTEYVWSNNTDEPPIEIIKFRGLFILSQVSNNKKLTTLGGRGEGEREKNPLN